MSVTHASFRPGIKRIGEIDILSSTRTGGTSDAFVVRLPVPLKDVTALTCYEIQMPKIFYNIFAAGPKQNNTLYYDVGAGTASVTIPAGAYNATSLITALNAALLSAGTTITVNFSTTTFLTTIATSAGTLALPFASSSASTIAQILGFIPANLTGATSYTSTNGINLDEQLSVYINMREISVGSTTTDLLAGYAFKIAMGGNFPGDVVVWRAQDSYDARIDIPKRDIYTLTINLIDSKGQQINMLGYDWSMLLHAYSA